MGRSQLPDYACYKSDWYPRQIQHMRFFRRPRYLLLTMNVIEKKKGQVHPNDAFFLEKILIHVHFAHMHLPCSFCLPGSMRLP